MDFDATRISVFSINLAHSKANDDNGGRTEAMNES